jgi:hypothetical protein
MSMRPIKFEVLYEGKVGHIEEISPKAGRWTVTSLGMMLCRVTLDWSLPPRIRTEPYMKEYSWALANDAYRGFCDAVSRENPDV